MNTRQLPSCAGGIPVSLNDLTEEHRQQLHYKLHQELRNPVPAEDENAASDGNADTEPESMP